MADCLPVFWVRGADILKEVVPESQRADEREAAEKTPEPRTPSALSVCFHFRPWEGNFLHTEKFLFPGIGVWELGVASVAH